VSKPRFAPGDHVRFTILANASDDRRRGESTGRILSYEGESKLGKLYVIQTDATPLRTYAKYEAGIQLVT
jgi:hypothetical protein